MAPPAAEIHLEHAGSFAERSGEVEGRSLGAWRREARAHLKLPDAPVVAAGHQANAWHAGILAKTLWTDALADRGNATPAHVVVDQDEFDGLYVEWPELVEGSWRANGNRFGQVHERIASLRAPSFAAREIERVGETPGCVVEGLARLTRALNTHRNAPNAASQITRAQLDGVAGLIRAPRIVNASDFMGTTFARHIVERMLKDPIECAGSYNLALQLHPRAARPLRIEGSRCELPLWILDESGRRIHATSESARSAMTNDQPLLPRASLLGVLLRTALADRFTHGLGGKIYEEVSNAWIARWLGWRPPPFDVVSATLLLPIDHGPRQPEWTMDSANSYRNAWCDPDLAASGRTGPSERRGKFLASMAGLPRGSPARKKIYQELIDDRHARRGDMALALEKLRERDLAQLNARRSLEVRTSRSWCVSLHPPESIRALHEQLVHRARDLP